MSVDLNQYYISYLYINYTVLSGQLQILYKILAFAQTKCVIKKYLVVEENYRNTF